MTPLTPTQEKQYAAGRHIRILWELEGGRCHYCRKDISIYLATIDHVMPIGRGGKNVLSNKVCSCRQCNSDKACLSPSDWRAVLASRGIDYRGQPQ